MTICSLTAILLLFLKLLLPEVRFGVSEKTPLRYVFSLRISRQALGMGGVGISSPMVNLVCLLGAAVVAFR